MIDDRNLINIASRGVATQSSLSKYSTSAGAQAAVDGTAAPDFAIHTNADANPWWALDLRHVYPIELIVIHNRKQAALQARARRLKVEVSIDGVKWIVVHQGIAHFGAGPDDMPLMLPLKGRVIAQRLRISLDERQYLHLSRVDVYVSREAEAFRVAWTSVGLRYGKQFRRTTGSSAVDPIAYKVLFRLIEGEHSAVDGLRLTGVGRFGNKMIQICHALLVARAANLKYIQLPKFEFISNSDPVTIEGVTLVSSNAPKDPSLTLLDGEFLYEGTFTPLLNGISNKSRYEASQKFIRPFLPAATGLDGPSDDELVIHIRSGDVFDEKPHPDYAQPPLAFYTRVVDKMLAAKTVRRVAIVAEDRLNPCIDALGDYISGIGAPFRHVSGSFIEDVCFLSAAKHLVFGFGTFGHGICLLADRIHTLHTFGSPGFDDYPNIEYVSTTYDQAEKYIRQGEWNGSEHQRKLMIDYPSENLYDEVAPLNRLSP